MSSEIPESAPAEGEIDFRNNPESRAAQESAPSLIARASEGGAPPRDAPRTGEAPEEEEGGTADGDPLSGVTAEE